MAFTRLEDITVHHASSGGAAGSPALVCVNSLGTDLRIWDDLVPYFADRFQVIRYDLRGHGLTDATLGPYAIEGLAADLARLLDRLAVRDALICGLSIGGMVAQRLATAHPELVRGLADDLDLVYDAAGRPVAGSGRNFTDQAELGDFLQEQMSLGAGEHSPFGG